MNWINLESVENTTSIGPTIKDGTYWNKSESTIIVLVRSSAITLNIYQIIFPNL